jgi:cytosine/adenosine deaminase-related metal-dependent hydrolase
VLKHRLLSAEVVYNGLGTPRANGAVVVQGEGEDAQIVAVDGLERARLNFPDAAEERAGFALSPPPVNAHTHLDLSSTPAFAGSYGDFIRHVIAHGASHRGLEAAKAGAAELEAEGVTVVGDVVAREEVMVWLLQRAKLTGVAYWEVLGPNPGDAERIFAETVEKLRFFRRLERPGGMRVGLAPHAPHTVSAPLLQRLAGLARQEDLPMQIHVAESPAEGDFHARGSGPLMDLMRPSVPDWRPSGLSPLGYLISLGVLAARPTLVHMIHVSEDDIREVQRAGCAVVHCPRSNTALGCGRFPWRLYMKHGAEVALGTDSRASSPSLSVAGEVAAARALHGDEASPRALVRAAVKGGYRALGLRPPRLLRGDPAGGLYLWPE